MRFSKTALYMRTSGERACQGLRLLCKLRRASNCRRKIEKIDEVRRQPLRNHVGVVVVCFATPVATMHPSVHESMAAPMLTTIEDVTLPSTHHTQLSKTLMSPY